MSKKVWIVGAGGFGFQVLGILLNSHKFKKQEIDFAGFIDDRSNIDNVLIKQLLENFKLPEVEVRKNIPNDFDWESDKFIFGLSKPKFKKNFVRSNELKAKHFLRLLCNADGFTGNKIGKSTMHHMRLSTNVSLGHHNFVDANTVLGHDCTIGNFNHIGVGTIVGGGAKIGNGNIIHSGAIIGNNVTIGNRCEIGIGCCVVRSLPNNTKIISPKPGYL